ncbi:MAG: 16S rRNA (adenine(1518)-N(6)/adenine(1519)-N(6))-dimethyltransferase, partial [Candidatus Sungiibacteriota bacterium]
EKNFFSLLHAGFSQKRKRLTNALAKFFGGKKNAEEKIKKAGLAINARPQELNLTEWTKLLRD